MRRHRKVTCPCCKQKLSAAKIQKHLSVHNMVIAEVECGPRDTISTVISSAINKRADKDAVIWDAKAQNFENIRWSYGEFTEKNSCRANAIIELLARVTTDVLGPNPPALDVFVCVCLSMYWRKPCEVQQNARRIVHIGKVYGIIRLLHAVCARHSEIAAIMLIEHAIDLASRLQPGQSEESQVDIDYTEKDKVKSYTRLFNKLCEAARPTDLRRRMPQFVQALDKLQSVLVSRMHATSGPSDGNTNRPELDTVCVAHQILETSIDHQLLSNVLMHLPLTFDNNLVEEIANLRSGIVSQRNPNLTKAKTVPEQRSLLDLISCIHPGFSTSVSSLRHIFNSLITHWQKYKAPLCCKGLLPNMTNMTLAGPPFPFHISLNPNYPPQSTPGDVVRYNASLSKECIIQLYTKLVHNSSVYPMYCCGVNQVASLICVNRVLNYDSKLDTFEQEFHLTDDKSDTLDTQQQSSKRRRISH